MKNKLAALGVGVLFLLGILYILGVAAWCVFLLYLLHWVAMKIGFSDNAADWLVGIVVAIQAIPILIVGLGAIVAARWSKVDNKTKVV